MINIIFLIDSLFSNNFKDFFKIINFYLYYHFTHSNIIKLIEDIKWYYMFNDLINAKKNAIYLIKLIHFYNY